MQAGAAAGGDASEGPADGGPGDAPAAAEAAPDGKRDASGMGESPVEGGSGQARERDFHGEKRGNQTHESTTDPEAKPKGRRSAIDGRVTSQPGYAASQRIRKRIEQAFGWMKSVGGMRKVKLRGRAKVGWAFTFTAAAYNLWRLAKLQPA